jgi:hypothetical protein
LPLIFISGVFIPLNRNARLGAVLGPLSPLSYASDLIHAGLGGTSYPLTIDVAALIAFAITLLLLRTGCIAEH